MQKIEATQLLLEMVMLQKEPKEFKELPPELEDAVKEIEESVDKMLNSVPQVQQVNGTELEVVNAVNQVILNTLQPEGKLTKSSVTSLYTLSRIKKEAYECMLLEQQLVNSK